MNLTAPVSTIMSTNIKTLSPSDKLLAAKELFDSHSIHHIPVVDETGLVGIVSKLDYIYFLRPIHVDSQEQYLNNIRLKNYKISEVMTKRVVSIESSDSIQMALEIFSDNLFHALPIVDKGELVGMITTHDIIYSILHPKKEKHEIDA